MYYQFEFLTLASLVFSFYCQFSVWSRKKLTVHYTRNPSVYQKTEKWKDAIFWLHGVLSSCQLPSESVDSIHYYKVAPPSERKETFLC